MDGKAGSSAVSTQIQRERPGFAADRGKAFPFTQRHEPSMRTLAMLSCLVVAGCAGPPRVFRAPDWHATQTLLVAVAPFDNLSSRRKAGQIISDIIEIELMASGRVKVVEPGRVAGALRARPDLDQDPVALALAVGAEAVLAGRVMEYEYRATARGTPVVVASARLLAARDGRVLWTTLGAQAGTGAFAEEDLGQTAADVCRWLVESMTARAPE